MHPSEASENALTAESDSTSSDQQAIDTTSETCFTDPPMKDRDKDRRDKILDVAIELAEKGGYNNVRQREVAAQAGVALGTLYKRFRSKEDILCAALARETETLERRMEAMPAKGDTPLERICSFFKIVTKGLITKPNYARAVLRAMASGEPEIAANVAAYQGHMNGLIIAAIRGTGRLGYAETTSSPPTEMESTLALHMLQVWYASLVGWSAGVTSQQAVQEQVQRSAELLFKGLEAEQKMANGYANGH
jgi:TetR/AcrR family transcriptional regulator, cholesterol catabolism regulator